MLTSVLPCFVLSYVVPVTLRLSPGGPLSVAPGVLLCVSCHQSPPGTLQRFAAQEKPGGSLPLKSHSTSWGPHNPPRGLETGGLNICLGPGDPWATSHSLWGMQGSWLDPRLSEAAVPAASIRANAAWKPKEPSVLETLTQQVYLGLEVLLNLLGAGLPRA